MELSQTCRQNTIACCIGEQPVFIRSGDFHGGQVIAVLGGRALCLFQTPTLPHLWWWLTWTLYLVQLMKTSLITSSVGCLSWVCRSFCPSSCLLLCHCRVASQLLICGSYSLETGGLLAFTRQPSLLFLPGYSHATRLTGGIEKGIGFVRVSYPFSWKLVGIVTCN